MINKRLIGTVRESRPRIAASVALQWAALLANLQIDTRTCHYFPVGYLPAGLDATVSWGGPEFKFTNNRNWPIKIVASVDTAKNTVSVHIVGTDEDGSYVQMTYATWLVYGNSEYPETATGYKAATYRNVYDKNGKVGLVSTNREINQIAFYEIESL